MVDFLVDQGAAIDLCTAATFGFLEDLNTILEQSPEAVLQKCQGANVLNWAVRPRRHYENAVPICTRLIRAGADLHDEDEDENGMTPLHHAAEWGGRDPVAIIDCLLEAGADPTRKDSQGWTALDYAKDRKREAVVERLELV